MILHYDDGLRFITDPDAEPEPLRSQLWALVAAGAVDLDDTTADPNVIEIRNIRVIGDPNQL